MGETKVQDQPTKRRRQLCGLGKSSSDSEIARSKYKERWPFTLQSLTVDELARYRRRRVQDRPKDTLCRTEGSLGNIVTEYRRAFRASSEDISKRLELPQVFGKNIIKGPICNLHINNADKIMETRTESSRFIPHLNAPGRPPQLRRGTSLKREGKFSSDTEQLSCYVPYKGNHKAELARRPTSLKMEGNMSTQSENCEKFIQWLNVSRPEPARFISNLKLEGDIETTTENHEKYIPFVGARRPEILRQNANLKIEGESSYMPEYTEVFKGHDVRGRRTLKKPTTHLKIEGNFYNTTETSEQFINPRLIIGGDRNLSDNNNEDNIEKLDTENDDDDDDDEEEEEEEDHENEEENLLELENLNKIRSKNDFKESVVPLEIPEYRDAFKNFPRERPKLIKPSDEIGRSDGSKILSSSPARSKFDKKIDMDPEYKSKFLDLSRESPVYRKPPLALRPSAINSGSLDRRMQRNLNPLSPAPQRGSSRFNDEDDMMHRRRLFESEQQATSEVRSQYIPYGNIPRVESVKMPTNLQLEGNIDLQPEYRNAYCTKRNYQIPNGEPRMHRRRERSSSESRRRDNYWSNNNNGENFGRINASDDQDAFQLLNTRVHDDSVIGKPPSGSRRSSLVNRPSSQVDMRSTDVSIIRKRSPSPTYRLHVCNVDDEPRGFGRRKQTSTTTTAGGGLRQGIESGNNNIMNNNMNNNYNNANNNTNDNNPIRRSYSPSFGRAVVGTSGDPTKSFVVLEDNKNHQRHHHMNNQITRDPSAARLHGPLQEYNRGRNRPLGIINHNYNQSNISSRDQFRPRNKTPPNWMRPWYDNGGSNIN